MPARVAASGTAKAMLEMRKLDVVALKKAHAA
jgi:hypothetical protein